jgi:hypothetical protein
MEGPDLTLLDPSLRTTNGATINPLDLDVVNQVEVTGNLTKNVGPLLTSWVNGNASAFPQDWTARIGFYQEDQQMPLGYTLPALSGTLLESRLIQTRTDERKRTSLVLSSLTDPNGGGGSPPGGGPPNSWQLIEEVRLPQGQVATRTRAIIPDDHPADSHLVLDDNMIQAEQKNLGLDVLEQTVLVAPLVTAPTIVDTKFDDTSSLITVSKTRKQTSTFVDSETMVGNLRQRITREGETATVATQVVTTDPVPGPAVISFRIAPDGSVITITKQRKLLSAINEQESATTTLWTKVYAEGETGLVAIEVKEEMTLPGLVVYSSRLDPDGLPVTISKQLMKAESVQSAEVIAGANWIRGYKGDQDGVVAVQVSETRSAEGHQLLAAEITPDYEVVFITKTQKEQGDIVPTATLNARQVTKIEKKEVSGLIGQEIRSVKNVIDKPLFGQSIDNPLPAQFRPFITMDDVSHISPGQAAQPVLAQDDVEKVEQQVDAFFKKVSSKSFDVTLPVVFSDRGTTEKYGGIVTSTEKRLDSIASGITITPDDANDFTFIDGKTTRSGRFVYREKTQIVGSYPLLLGTDIDTELNIPLQYTQLVVPAGTVGGTTASTATEVKPIDQARSLRTIRTVPTATINAFKLVLPGTVNIDFPNQLMSLTSYLASKTNTGGYYSEGGNFTIFNQGSGSMSSLGEAHGSSACSYDLLPVIKQTWGQGVPCAHWLFFMQGPVLSYSSILGKLNSLGGGGVQAWPKFKPQSAQLTCTGAKVVGSVKATVQMTSAVNTDYNGDITSRTGSTMSGDGMSGDVELTMKSVTIPPTIHGPINIGGMGTSHPENFSAWATISVSGIGTRTKAITGNATCVISPASLPATAGATSIPTAGKFCYQLRVEPYKYGFLKCDCLVVAAADWT